MTTETRKAALDAILERIRLEGYQDYDHFAKKAAQWFADHDSVEISEEVFIDEFRTVGDFYAFNEVNDREYLLEAIFDDATDAIEIAPSTGPRQLYIDEIDSFSKVADVKSSEVDIRLPLEVLEEDVKNYLREIIGEPFVQKDWPGERNDLFTNHVLVNDRRVDAAFMLKGPGVSGNMFMSDAGKRGTQVQRLFESPADLYVVQFNGKIEDRTIQHVKEQAEVTSAAMYCIIDGADTARLLTAYGKI